MRVAEKLSGYKSGDFFPMIYTSIKIQIHNSYFIRSLVYLIGKLSEVGRSC